jgi:hypothetical protein
MELGEIATAYLKRFADKTLLTRYLASMIEQVSSIMVILR